jgi:hypothetical protein
MSPTLPQSHSFGPMYPSPSHWSSSSPSNLRADSAAYSPSFRQMSPHPPPRTPMYSESYQHQQFQSQSTPKRSPYHHPRSVVPVPVPSKSYHSEYDDADRLTTDSYMESHSVHSGDESDNLFDFVLLPGVMNARRGMKVAAPETIPCKYGHTCFRRDCRFAHGSVDETTGLAPRDHSISRIQAHHTHHSSFSSSRARSPSSGYSSSSNDSSPASEPATPPRYPIMQDFAISL